MYKTLGGQDGGPVFTEESGLREVSPNGVLVDDEPAVRALLKRQRVSSLLSPPRLRKETKPWNPTSKRL